MTDEEMEIGDIAVHGHEVYPSDVPSLGYPDGISAAAPAAAGGWRRLTRRPGCGRQSGNEETGTAPALSRGRFHFRYSGLGASV